MKGLSEFSILLIWGAHSGAVVLLVKLIQFGYIARLSQWGRMGPFTCHGDYYLTSRRITERRRGTPPRDTDVFPLYVHDVMCYVKICDCKYIMLSSRVEERMYSTSSHFPTNLIVYIIGADPCVQYCGEYICPSPPTPNMNCIFHSPRTITVVGNFYRFVLFCTENVKLLPDCHSVTFFSV
jgi:hypothetical protein